MAEKGLFLNKISLQVQDSVLQATDKVPWKLLGGH
jgi:hypothetical protein